MNSTSTPERQQPKGPWRAIAWSVWGLSLIFTALGVVFLALSYSTPIGVRWGPRGYAAAFAVAYSTVGALIVARHPRNVIGWIFCHIGLFNGIQTFVEEYAVYALLTSPGSVPAGDWVAWVQTWFWVLAAMPILLLAFLFPDGRLLSPRWQPALWLSGFSIALLFFGAAFGPGPLQSFNDLMNPYALGGDSGIVPFIYDAAFLLLVVTFLTGAASMLVRFRRSRGEERQQLKWFTYAAVLIAIVVAVFRDEPTVGALIGVVAMLALPVATAIAILRYRLYDIDLLIRKTLVYSALTGLLALTYFGSVVILQSLFTAVTGQQSAVAIVLSTLAIAALFNPVRRRVQDAIDRRFYRKKYDAAKVIAEFAGTCRDETDLDRLTARLVEVVEETMQPESVGLWLKDSNAKPVLSVAEGTQRGKDAKKE